MSFLSRRSWQVVAAVAAMGLLLGSFSPQVAAQAAPQGPAQAQDASAIPQLKRLTEGAFVENLGQWDAEAKFRAGGVSEGEVWFAPSRLMYTLWQAPEALDPTQKPPEVDRSVPPPPNASRPNSRKKLPPTTRTTASSPTGTAC